MRFDWKDLALLIIISLGCFTLGNMTMFTIMYNGMDKTQPEALIINTTIHEVKYVGIPGLNTTEDGNVQYTPPEPEQVYKYVGYYPKFADPDLINVETNYRTGETIIKIKKPLGTTHLACTSFSMAPWMGCGNMGLTEPTNNDTTFNVGDVIIFKNPWNGNGTVIHQIISMNESCILTKGLNNRVDDNDCLQKDDIKSRMWFMFPTANDTVRVNVYK